MFGLKTVPWFEVGKNPMIEALQVPEMAKPMVGIGGLLREQSLEGELGVSPAHPGRQMEGEEISLSSPMMVTVDPGIQRSKWRSKNRGPHEQKCRVNGNQRLGQSRNC